MDMLEVEPTDPQQISAKKQLAASLAQQSTNGDYNTRQANQFGQFPNFQSQGPDASTEQGFDENGDGSVSGAPQPTAVESPVPQATAGPVAQFPGQTSVTSAASTNPAPTPSPAATSSSAKDLAMQILGEMHANAKPNSAAAKGTAQDYLTTMNQQAIDQMKQSAASRGVSGGWVGGTEAEMLSSLGPQLTGAYRNVDMQDQSQYFANLLSTLGGAQGLAGLDLNYDQLDLSRELGLGGLDVQRAGLGIQGQSLALQQANAQRDANNDYWNWLISMFG